MTRTVSYDPSHKALLRPGEADDYFAGWSGSESEAALCAEISRLAYCRDRDRISRKLATVEFELVGKPFDRAGSFGFLARRQGLSVLAFRGTEPKDVKDLLADANIGLKSWGEMGKVHTGFAEALECIWKEIHATLEGSSGELVCTGHSLGASLATLAASRLPASRLLTFGSPRVGNAGFAAAFEDRTNDRRFVDCCDLVTWALRSPYKHVGRLEYLDKDGVLVTDPEDSFVKADRSAARWVYLKKYSWRWGTELLRGMADHAPINYVSALRVRRTPAPADR